MKTVVLGLAAACALLTAAPAAAQPTPDDQKVMTDYYSCMRQAARRLEPSEEPAEAIARASRVLCQPQSDAVMQVWIRLAPQQAEANNDRAIAWGDTEAIAEVLATRLCRKAKDCRSF